jgi:sarcosine oxidase subunit gamma
VVNAASNANLDTQALRSPSALVRAPGALVRSPFEGHTHGSRPNAAGHVGVHLRAGLIPSFTLISTWISGLPGLLDALTTVFGDTVPQRIGKTASTEFGLLARSGPEEYFLVGDDPTDRAAMLCTLIGADTGAVTDLSHARCRIRIEGPQSRSVLGKLFALDLRESALAIGDVAMTGTHHVPSTLHRLGTDAFDWYVFSTYAYDQLATLLDAAQEYGLALQLESGAP